MHYVLVVADDEEDVSFLEQAFHAQPGNIPVKSMNKGLNLWEFICSHPIAEFPFLIVLDQHLPDINSLDLLIRLKGSQHSKLIPVAVMAGFAGEDLIREYYMAGANCFYKKPLDLPDWSHMADCLLTLFHNRQ
jgi:CheY-like chemotaxis protein